MRRNLTALTGVFLILGGVFAVAVPPAAAAGSAGHPPRELHGRSVADHSGPGTHITSSVPPLTTGYVEYLDGSDDFQYATGSVQTPVDLSGIGDAVQVQMNLPDNDTGGASPVIVTVENVTPLQVGQIYGYGESGEVSVESGSTICSSGVLELCAVEIDQLTESAGVITSLAIQVAAAGISPPLESFYGAIAYKAVPTTPHQGYYIYGSDGELSGFGNDNFLVYLGDLSAFQLNAPVVGTAQTADGGGYWMVASDGGIFAYGDAHFYGSMGGRPLNEPIVGMAATPDGKGYWLVASDGGLFAFGDAAFYGSMGGHVLNKPIVGMAATPDGKGYWLVASDGGIFAFGDAHFYGSTGNIKLNKPVVGMTRTLDGKGYWLVASDGGIFAYGDAGFHGSAGNLVLAQPIVGMASSADGKGYWLVASDGGIFSFGDAPYYGSVAAEGEGITDVAGISTLPGLST